MIWIVRAPTYDEVKVLAARVENCIKYIEYFAALPITMADHR